MKSKNIFKISDSSKVLPSGVPEQSEGKERSSLGGAEWLETNGLGGWASSSIIGCNTRRYHGLLIAATKPPAERTALVSKLDETIVLTGERYELGTNQYQNNTIHPAGQQYLKSFTKDFFPEWIYEIKGVELKKTIAMIHNENTTVIVYEVIKAPQSFQLELLPLLSVRGYHAMMHANDAVNRNAEFTNDTFITKLYNDTPDIYINVPGGDYYHHPDWFLHFNYAVEQYRGLDFDEDLFNPGHFSVALKEGDKIGIILSTENPAGRNAIESLQKEKARREKLVEGQPKDEMLQQLIFAADQFIVRRTAPSNSHNEEAPPNLPQGEACHAQSSLFGELDSCTVFSSSEGCAVDSPPLGESEGAGALATIIAGYHWFTDWGRDTMISLPGLCLSTGRYEDAKKIITAFANSVSMGMLPNRFQDNNEPPEYNNVDGTLWYFIAIKKYLEATGDEKFVIKEILPVLKEIIDWHFRGTRYNIHVDEDGLLYAGETGQQLTWMDARIGTWVVTPRMGKPVEIQALWYNVLKIFAELLRMNEQEHDAELVDLSAAKAKDSFDKLFWYAEGNYLYDVIDEHGMPDASLRPNQLFAVSLPYALIEGDKAKAIVKIVEDKLYTPVGLRSLPADDVHYIHKYGGDQWHRDSSYHEGTVWSWLLGPYIDSLIKVKSEKSKVKKVIEDFKYHLNEGCIGSVSEIFDADAPHHPRGCIAQAWGVAEVLRVIKDYSLFNTAKKRETVNTKNKLAENLSSI
jgi:glycogen debranching enzyme